MIRQCATQSVGYIDHQSWMVGDAQLFNAKLFIQSQFSGSPCIEIHFDRVSKLLLENVSIDEACGKFEDQKVFISFSLINEESFLHNGYDIIAEEIKYRILDKSFLGEGLAF